MRVVYSTNSDPSLAVLVSFRFGVICWEVVSLTTAWSDLKPDQIRAPVVSGERPSIPESAPSNIACAIEEAWTHDPTKRPTVTKLKKILDEVSNTGERALLWSVFFYGRWPRDPFVGGHTQESL